MQLKKPIALCGATVAAVLAPAAAAATGGTSVNVRIEGTKRTLLQPTTVHTRRGWITKAHTPRGKCPATSAAGALDVATRHRWGGSYDHSFGLEITSILGERHTFSSPYFWEVFINNRVAQVGACGLRLHRGDRLVFAAATVKTQEDLTAIRAPAHATAGQPFKVKVVWLNAGGKAKPLSGAHVHVGGRSVTTNAAGLAQVTSKTPGTLVLRADHKGYIRAARVRVHVS